MIRLFLLFLNVLVHTNLDIAAELRVLVGLERSRRIVAFILLQYHLITPVW